MTGKLKIQFYKDRKGEWRWRIKSGAKVLADSGEGYKRLASAVKGLNRVAHSSLLVRQGEPELSYLDETDFRLEVIR